MIHQGIACAIAVIACRVENPQGQARVVEHKRVGFTAAVETRQHKVVGVGVQPEGAVAVFLSLAQAEGAAQADGLLPEGERHIVDGGEEAPFADVLAFGEDVAVEIALRPGQIETGHIDRETLLGV